MLRIAFAGTPDFAVPALEALAGSAHALVGVLTQPDRPAGRGRGLTASAVKRRALELGIPVAQPASLATAPERSSLEAWQCELLVVVAYGLLLPPSVLQLPRLGCLNVHASLLPRWRGAAPIQRAILAGDKETGVTLMQMDRGLDTGAMLARRTLAIDDHCSARELQHRLAALGAALLLETLPALERGTLRAEPQPAEGASYAAKLDKREARLDWQRSAAELSRQIRAFNPWPVAETRWDGRRVRLWQAHVAGAPSVAALGVATGSAAAPAAGTVLGFTGDALLVACGQQVLAVTELQLEGRRALPAAEFVRGQPLDGVRFD
jgi:methionyl-tRNA formyltransferase